MSAAWAPRLDTRQGGLRPRAEHSGGSERGEPRPVRRWKRPSESELAASSSGAAAAAPSASAPPPPPEGSHRWAGPGASWPLPRPGSYSAEQFHGTLPGLRGTTHSPQTLSSPASPAASSSGNAAGPRLADLPANRPRVYLVWHKQSDLRIHDHEPLARAHLENPRLPVVHLHAFDPFWFGRTRVGRFPKTGSLRAQFWRECVQDLQASLRQRGQELLVRSGVSAAQALRELARAVDVVKVFAYSEVCSEELQQEAELEAVLRQVSGPSAELVRCWGYTLHHFDDLKAARQQPERWITPYLSFGAFKKEVAGVRVRPVGYEWQDSVGSGGLAMCPPPELQEPAEWSRVPSLRDLGFSQAEVEEAEAPDARAQFDWRGGESFALRHLEEYVWDQRALKQYVGTTDWSAGGKCSASAKQTSKLSPWLAFGCVSPRLVYWEALRFEKADRCKGVRGLVNSLLWRDFYRFIVLFAWGDRMYHLYGPMSCGSMPGGHKVPTKWCCKHYNNIFGGSDPRLWTWGKDMAKFRRWADGTTGYPFVDAAMLELRRTGYLRHLSRETVGWFFVRDLQLDWRLAAEWFESCLVDYDCVLNWGNWAYFILTQLPAREDDRPGGGPRYTLPMYSPFLMASQVLSWGSEHDPTAAFVKRWLPQLQGLPPDLAREPWRLAEAGLAEAAGEVSLAVALARDAPGGSAVGWACEACTLENALARRTCEACGRRRPRLGAGGGAPAGAQCSGLGIYGEAPIVPPPPDGSEQWGVCDECGCESPGWLGEDGSFFCAECWAGWAADAAPFQAPAEEGRGGRRREQAPDPSKGWALVPGAALPGSVGPAGPAQRPLQGPGAEAPGRGATEAGGARRKRGARWAVRGDRSEALVGG